MKDKVVKEIMATREGKDVLYEESLQLMKAWVSLYHKGTVKMEIWMRYQIVQYTNIDINFAMSRTASALGVK